MKLFTRFFLILLSFALLPVLVTGIWLARSNAAARENARLLHQTVTRLCADSVDAFAGDMNRTLAFVQELAPINLLTGAAPKGRKGRRQLDEEGILQRAAATYPVLGLVSLLGPDGRETIRFADVQAFPTGGFEDRSGDPLVRRVRASGQAAWGRVADRRGQPYLPVVHPLPAGKLVYAEYSLQGLRRRISGLALGKTGRLFLVDEAGRPLPGFDEDYPEPVLGPWHDPSGWADTVATKKGPMVAAWASCPALGWRVLSLQSRDEALAASPHFAAQAGVFLLCLTGLVVLGAFWMGSRMVKPLQDLIAASERSARNEFDRTVPESGWGELSVLTRGFNVMMRTLRNYQEMQVDRIFEEKAKVESLVHTIPDGIVMAGFDGKILYLNARARAILSGGAAKASLLGAGTVHEAFREPALREMVLPLMQHKEVSVAREVELRSSQGHRLGIFVCQAVTVMHNDRAIGIVLIMRDVTAERDLERLREDFYHGVVHDLRGPLTTVDGFIGIMQERWERLPAEKIRTYLDYVRVSAERMRRLVADILDTAKIESGNMKLELQPVPASEFAQRAKALYSLQTETTGVAMVFESLAAPERPLLCDRNLVERVLMNLLGNALHFTPKGGQVILRVAASGADEAEFSVQDTGPGIPKEKLELVFEKVRQLEGGGHRSAGYGMGLSICKKIVELHGGRIWAESEPGQGSRFVFRLPLQGPRP